jgi:hypothetical protein
VESARLVSLLCFYLTLPAVWLFLRALGLDPARRWLALAFVPAIPVFVYYSRAFLIESMALMFASWFVAALYTGLQRGRSRWLVFATVMGVGGALVKITTFGLFLLPVAAAFAWSFRRAPAEGRWPLVIRVALTTAPALVGAMAWIFYTDRIKALNPAADMLQSGPQRTYNFGHLADRISPDYWKRWLDLSSHAVIHPMVFVGFVVAVLFLPRTWRWRALAGIGLFALGPAIFPFLYAWHDYYYYAIALFLALALGLAAVGLFSTPLPRCLSALVIIAALVVQGRLYCREYLQEQRVKGNGDTGLTQLLYDFTDADDVLVVAGQDWNSMLPWSAQRRALMIRRGFEFNAPYLARAFSDLKGEVVAALVLTGDTRHNAPLVALAVEKLNLHPEPFAEFTDSTLYVNRDLRDEWSARAPFSYDKVRLLSRNEHVTTLLARPLSELHAKSVFGGMTPRPVRFEVPFGLSSYWPTPRPVLNTHATTHLWFDPGAGRKSVEIDFGILDTAWQRPDKTDGVEFAFDVIAKGQPARRVWSRLLNPAAVARDRGLQTAKFTAEIPANAELEFSALPGPAGINSYDWAYVSRIDLR